MVAETKIRVAGVWKEITEAELRVAGTWREITRIEKNVGGVWKEVFHPQPSGVVTLSGEIVTDDTGLKVGIRFAAGGVVSKLIGGVYTQVDTGTDWIIPQADAPDLFELMTDNWVDTGGAGDGFEDEAAASGVWVPMASSRLWSVLAAGIGGSNSNGMDFDAHIRWNGGATLDSGAYSVTSEDFS